MPVECVLIAQDFDLQNIVADMAMLNFSKDYIYSEISWNFKFSKASAVKKYNWFTNIGCFLCPLSTRDKQGKRESSRAHGI